MKTPNLPPRLLYALFAAVAFLLALRWTFPAEAVKERLIYEAGAAGWQVDVDDVHPSGLLGVRMENVSLTDAAGLKIPIERVDGSLRLLPLLVGRTTLDFEASIFDGTVEGTAGITGGTRPLVLDLDGVDLSRALPLRKSAGRDLAGKVTGHVDLTLPGGTLDKASGTAQLSVAKALVGAGPIPVPPMGNLNGPAIDLGNVAAAGKIDQGRLTLEKLETRGGDVELTGEGVAVVLQPTLARMSAAAVTGQARVKFQSSLWQKPEANLLRGPVEALLGASKGPDGSYRVQLGGTLGRLQPKPATGGGGGAPPSRPGEPGAE